MSRDAAFGSPASERSHPVAVVRALRAQLRPESPGRPRPRSPVRERSQSPWKKYWNSKEESRNRLLGDQWDGRFQESPRQFRAPPQRSPRSARQDGFYRRRWEAASRSSRDVSWDSRTGRRHYAHDEIISEPMLAEMLLDAADIGDVVHVMDVLDQAERNHHCIRRLLAYRNLEDQTALHGAARRGSQEMCDLLIAKTADALSASGPNHVTPLMLASLSGHKDVVRRLLSLSSAQQQISACDAKGRNCLHVACCSDPEIMLLLLQLQPDLLQSQDQLCRNPLYYALANPVEKAQMKILTILLLANCDPHQVDSMGRSPLWYAADAGAVESRDLMLRLSSRPTTSRSSNRGDFTPHEVGTYRRDLGAESETSLKVTGATSPRDQTVEMLLEEVANLRRRVDELEANRPSPFDRALAAEGGQDPDRNMRTEAAEGDTNEPQKLDVQKEQPVACERIHDKAEAGEDANHMDASAEAAGGDATEPQKVDDFAHNLTEVAQNLTEEDFSEEQRQLLLQALELQQENQTRHAASNAPRHSAETKTEATSVDANVTQDLSHYFVKWYKEGGVFEHEEYEHDPQDWCWIHEKSGIKVWQDALDLTGGGGSGEVQCFFHYTSELGFHNITDERKKAVEVFASLVTGGPGANAWWGNSTRPKSWNAEPSKASKRQNKLPQAERLYQQTLERKETALGREHPSTLVLVHNLAVFLKRQGRLPEAEDLLWRAVRGRELQLGPDHPSTLDSVGFLAELLEEKGELEEAEGLLRRVVAAREAQLGATDPKTLDAVFGLAKLLEKKGALEEAEDLFVRALHGMEVG